LTLFVIAQLSLVCFMGLASALWFDFLVGVFAGHFKDYPGFSSNKVHFVDDQGVLLFSLMLRPNHACALFVCGRSGDCSSIPFWTEFFFLT